MSPLLNHHDENQVRDDIAEVAKTNPQQASRILIAFDILTRPHLHLRQFNEFENEKPVHEPRHGD
jgi:hypothetical protein